jgi:hypothetical protein
MLARLRLFGLVAVALVCGASPTFAQGAATGAPGSAAGPRLDATATAIRRPAQPLDSTASLQRRQRNSMGQPVALMVVGGAAVILGALIGDDVGTVFMIGGAVMLLIGLYKYLQ